MSGIGMNRFESWGHGNLARFCQECYQKMKDQQQEINTLRDELRVALERLEVKDARKTD